MAPSYLTMSQFADALGVSTRTVQRWIANGQVVPAHRTLGGHARFTEAQVAEVRGRIAKPASGPNNDYEFVRKLIAKRRIVARR